MARQYKSGGYDTWSITAADGVTRAVFVPELGAIGSSLMLPGTDGRPRETLFRHDFFWERDSDKTRGGLPFLFPICGRLERGGQAETYHCRQRLYRMKIHGFAHRLPWRVTNGDDPARLDMSLRDTPATRRRYPFAFEVRLAFRVEPGALVCEQRYTNRSKAVMPYYAGFHPFFRTPPPGKGKSGALLDLTPARFLRYNTALTEVIGRMAAPPRPPFSVSDPGINERLIRLGADKTVRLRFPDGFSLSMRADGPDDPDIFPYLQLYGMEDKDFFCAEPWMGFPNALNTPDGARRLGPGATERACLRIAAGNP